ncbi:MATE family efflux transporter [Sphingomonas colocasiae]|uniref:MATE family efflux transporter n=1 Tax=Sphingomonas colocasiae TaxID=1848973 RepID=A0ABS7PRJ0_9SPHN|nr:MATE family efflux transporter [Sphingomonas colocasiae]MBY8823955.1 MATE family efflux transporter [Sphingomonas colocasiae]
MTAVTAQHEWRTEMRATILLALPLIFGNLAQSAIYATDLIWIGRLGADSLAAAALGVNLYTACMIFGMGLMTAASPMIARERGRRFNSIRDVRRTVRQSCWAAVTIALPLWAVMWNGEAILLLMDQDPALAAMAGTMLRWLQWGLLPYLFFLALRNYVSALERPRWAVGVLVAGLPTNALLAWILIFGHLGMPRMGLAGAGLASALTNMLLFLGLSAVVVTDRQFRRYRLFGRFWVADWPRYRAVWALGLPIAVTLAFEVTVFNAAVFLMGLIDKPSLAAHAIAIQISAMAFMVPMGLAQAATVRVGFWQGRGDARAVARAGWLSLAIAFGFSVLAAAVLIGAPRLLIGVFLDLRDPANALVVRLAVSFLAIAALFQIVDGAQAVGAGVLRGLHDTRVPMLYAGFGYWVVGIGVGTVLAFPLGLRGIGIWLGLASGLAAVAVLMVLRWVRRDRLGLIATG